ncbi:MAG: hypothetical protein IJC71_08720, partial [Clostridia bacterium]|nr:hypothetical protein [Clostridia bacterium]
VQLKAAEGLTLSSNAADITIVMSDEIISRRITVPSSNIVDTGARSGVEYTWDKSPVVISVIGTYDAIVSLQYEDIILELDMSPYSKTNTGTIRVRADVIFDTADSDKLLEIGTYDINVTFLN